MSKQVKNRKPLIIGIVAAVAILAVLLVLLLTQCTGGGEATQSTPAQTVGAIGEAVPYDLYWNLDRALYDGKSEAGMSSRKPESDGYFHVRFFKDGEIMELKVADRKTVNAIEVNDLMGLEFDSNGIVVNVISLDDMPLQQVGWKFYVQSIGGNLLKLNSAKSFDGMELLLEMLADTGLYDMTGAEGEVGKRITPIPTDRVIAIANLAGELTHVFIYERSEYMQTFEAECRHCKQTVTWKMWNKDSTLPTADGHYQLQNDIQLKKQQAVEEDAKVCLDLNGFAVDGANNARVYTLHNVGANLALMDTSEEQKGVLRGHSESSPQGGVVWVRYGAFYMYSGTLDGSDMTSVLNGTVVQVPKGCFFYMYGGTIIGGTSMYTYNEETGKYANGLGGTISVSGKFVMNDGLITGGRAQAAVSAWNKDGTPKTYQRGIGGNIYVAGGGEFEMRGGKIQNGVAGHSGGNVYLDGTATMTMDGGTITGGSVIGKGRNGGNVFVTTKATFTMNGGSINWGTSYNCGANLYFNGTVNMNSGYIGCGVIRDWSTNAVKPTNNATNVFQVGGRMTMLGGIIDGGYTATDSSATDKVETTIILGGLAHITGREELEYEDLVLTNGGSGIKVIVANLWDGAKIGVNATTGIFTTPTSEANVNNFYSTIEGADVLYVDGCIALGRMRCVCGSKEHYGKCDGTKLLWAPINSNVIPATTGNYFLAKDVTITAQVSLAANADVKVDLNGKTVTGPNNKRAFTTFNEGAKLTITDTSEGKAGVVKSCGKGDTQGNVVWVRYGSFDFYGGTLDGSGYIMHNYWNAGKDNVYGTDDDKTDTRDGGTVSMGGSTTFNMYGGTIIGNNIKFATVEKTITEGEGDKAVKKTVTRDVTSGSGGALSVANKCVFNMYDGVIRDGASENKGGNIYTSGAATLNLYGGQIISGRAGMYDKDDILTTYEDANGKIKNKSAGWGGNIDINDSSVVNLMGTSVVGGIAGGNGGNIRLGNSKATLNMSAGVVRDGRSIGDQGGNIFISGTANLTGGTVENGKAKNGGNIGINSPKDVVMKGITVSNGYAPGNGGNIRLSTTNTTGSLTIGEGTVITGGIAEKNGGNISIESNNANSNEPIGKLYITGGIISAGRAGLYDENGVLDLKDSKTTKKTETTDTRTIQIGDEKVKVDVIVTTTETRTKAVVSQGWGGNINLGTRTLLEMTGGEIVGGKSMNGGNIYTSGTAVAMLKGGTVADGTVGDCDANGDSVKVGYTVLTEERLMTAQDYDKPAEGDEDYEAKLAQYEAKLALQKQAEAVYKAPAATETAKSENVCNGWGGNIYVYAGTMNIQGSTVSGGISGGNGGSIYVRAKGAVLNMSAGLVSEGKSRLDQGGNIWAGTGSVLNITGGKILDGTCANGKNGGNIHCNAGVTVTLDNVAISGGTAAGKTKASANVNFTSGTKDDEGNITTQSTIVIGSVNIAGYVSLGSYNDVTLTGKPVITGGNTNLSMGGTKLKLSKLEAGANVGLTDSSAGIFTGETESAYASYFTSDVDYKDVVYVKAEKALGLGRLACLCGAQTSDKCVGAAGGCDETEHFWTAWTSGSSLPTTTGYYYLIKDVAVGSQASLANDQDVVLDLNGYEVSASGKNRIYALYNLGTSLTITDSVGTGTMVQSTNYDGPGGVVWVRWNGSSEKYPPVFNDPEAHHGTFTLIKGELVGSEHENTGTGSVVSVETYGEFYMYGGTIKDGTTNTKAKGGNVSVAKDAVMYMYGGTITGGQSGYGGNVYVAGELYVYDGTITNGRAVRDSVGGSGGNICVDGGSVTLTDTLVSGGKAGVFDENDEVTSAGWGGNIDMPSAGSLTLEGTTQILNGQCYGNGGNIRVNGTLTITGATISGGHTLGDNGGNIWLGLTSTLRVEGTVDKETKQPSVGITGGIANNGGNIHGNAGAQIYLENVLISGGSAKSGGNLDIYIGSNRSTLEIGSGTTIGGGIIRTADGEVTDHRSANVHIDNGVPVDLTIDSAWIGGGVYVGHKDSTVILQGTPVILNSKMSSNLHLNGQKVDVDGLVIAENQEPQIGVTDPKAGIFSAETTEKYKAYFVADDENLEVGFAEGRLYFTDGKGNLGLGRYNCICGAPGGVCLGEAGGCDGLNHFWSAWTSTTSLPNEHGYWYLVDNVTVSGQTPVANTEKDGQITVDKTNSKIFLDLNGMTVENKEGKNLRIYRLQAAGTALTVTDTTEAGDGVMRNNSTYTQGGIVWLNGTNVSFALVRGTLDTSDYKCTYKNGGAVVSQESSGTTFTMYGGTIYAPGAVKADGTEGTGYGKLGSGIYINGTATMYLKGGTINGGKAQFFTVTEEKDGKTTYTAGGGNGGAIYVDGGHLEISGGTISGGKAIFGGDTVVEKDKTVYKTGGGMGGSIYVSSGSMLMTGGTVTGGHAIRTTVQTGVNDKEEAVYSTGGGNGGCITLGADAQLTIRGGTVSGGQAMTDGQVHEGLGGNIYVAGTASLTMEARTVGEGQNAVTTMGTVSDGWAQRGGNIYLAAGDAKAGTDGGSMTLAAGTLTDGKAIRFDTGKQKDGKAVYDGGYGGNIYVADYASLEISGGAVEDGKAGRLNADGVTVEYGTNSDTKSGWGGNIEISDGGTLTMSGGTVSNGKAGGNGGNIRIGGGNATMEMTAGTVTGGETTLDQGGNIFNSGTLRLEGGLVNVLDANGNEVKDSEGNSVLVNSIQITNGKAYGKAGGNIAMNTSKSTSIEYATISGGQAANGGNIVIFANSKGNTLTIGEGAVIENGMATKDGEKITGVGGNIYGDVNNGNGAVNMEGGRVTGGQATNGGNIYVKKDVSVNMTGGLIENGWATNGGNIYLNTDAQMTVNGADAEINSGTAQNGDGGNIYMASGADFKLQAGTISDGKAAYTTGGGNGGNIFNSGGAITIEGGTISGGRAGILGADGVPTTKGWGGNINLYKTEGTSLTMSDGTITGGKSGGNGGNVYTSTYAVVTISGGTIADGESVADNGGNLWFAKDTGKITLEGSRIQNANGNTVNSIQISGGQSNNGKNIFVTNGTREISFSNITVDGGVYLYNAGTNTFGGVVQINQENSSDDLKIYGSTLLTLAEDLDAENSDIGIMVDKAGKFSVAVSQELADEKKAAFVSNHADTSVGVTSVKVAGAETLHLAIGRSRCLCGAANGAPHALGCQELGTDARFWQIWLSGNSLPTTSGDYYLTSEVILESQAGFSSANQEIAIDLNGQHVHEKRNTDGTSNKIIRLARINGANVALTLTDTASGGKFSNNAAHDQGVLFWVDSTGSSVILIKGELDASLASSRGTNNQGGTAVNLPGANTTFTMYGGELKAANAPNGGGAVCANNATATVNLYGGTVTQNANNLKTIYANGEVNISNATVGGQVEICAADASSASLNLSGAPTIGSVYLKTTGEYPMPVIEITGTLTNTTPIGVLTYNDLDVHFTGTTVEANAAKFTAVTEGKVVAYDSAAQKLTLGKRYCLCGQTELGENVTHALGCDKTLYLWTGWTSTNSLPTVTGNYYLTGPVSVSSWYGIAPNSTVRLDLNDQTVTDTSDRMLSLAHHNKVNNVKITNATLWITDNGTNPDAKGTLHVSDTSYTGQGCVVWVCGESNELNLIKGVLKADRMVTTSVQGGAVVCVAEGATFNMYGGELVGSTAADASSAFSVINGTVNVKGGTVTGLMNVRGGSVTVEGTPSITKLQVEKYNEAKNDTSVFSAPSVTLKGGPAIGSILLTKTSANEETHPLTDVAIPTITITGELTNTNPIIVSTYGDTDMDFATTTVAANAAKFQAANAAKDVSYIPNADSTKPGTLYLGKYDCLCGVESTNLADHVRYTYTDATGSHTVGCNNEKIRWTAWTSANTLPTTTGNYYLTGPVNLDTVQANVGVDQNVVLDLNGYTATSNNGKTGTNTDFRLFALAGNNASLTITDNYVVPENNTDTTRTGGKLLKAVMRDQQGNVVWVRPSLNATFTLIRGTLDGNNDMAGSEGAVVYVEKTGTFFMLGGSIENGSTSSNGGNVAIGNASVMHMAGGIIQDGKANTGGNIQVGDEATLYMSGGTITGGTAGSKTPADTTADDERADMQLRGTLVMTGGTIAGNVNLLKWNNNSTATLSLSGLVKIGRVNMAMGNGQTMPTITVAGTLANTETVTETVNGETVTTERELTPIQVTTPDNVEHLFCTSTALTSKNRFVGNGTLRVSLREDGLHLVKADENEDWYCVCGSDSFTHVSFVDANGNTVGCNGMEYQWMPLTAYTDVQTPGNYYLTDNLDLDGKDQLYFKAGVTRLDLNGYSISRSNYRAMTTHGATGAIVTITDTYTVPANNTDTNRVGAGVVLDYEDGTEYAGEGSGFWLGDNDAGNVLNWFNAKVDASRVTSTKNGGTVFFVNKGNTLNVFGGDFSAGTAKKASSSNPQGAAVRCIGVFNMFDGCFHDGKGNQWAGNVHIGGGGLMNMYGGSIIDGIVNGSADNACANLTLQASASFNMYGGTIDGRVSSVNNPTGTIRICNDAKIRAAENTNTSKNLTIASGVTYVVSNLNKNAQIYLNSDAASFTVTMEGTVLTLEQVNERLIAPGYTASISGNTITFTKNP